MTDGTPLPNWVTGPSCRIEPSQSWPPQVGPDRWSFKCRAIRPRLRKSWICLHLRGVSPASPACVSFDLG